MSFTIALILFSMLVAVSIEGRLERAMEGDEVALNEMVKELWPVMRGTARRELGRRTGQAAHMVCDGDVEDIVQRTLEGLFQNGWAGLRDFDPDRGTLKSWVARATTWRAQDCAKTKRRFPLVEPIKGDRVNLVDQLVSPVQSPETRIADRHDFSLWQTKFLQGQTARSALLYRLLILQGATPVEVGAVLGMRRNTVDQAKHRLVKALKACPPPCLPPQWLEDETLSRDFDSVPLTAEAQVAAPAARRAASRLDRLWDALRRVAEVDQLEPGAVQARGKKK